MKITVNQSEVSVHAMFKKFFSLITSDPLMIPIHIWNRIIVLCISRKNNIELKGRLILNGRPIIDMRQGSKLCIGDGVTLNSRNNGYHQGCPVKVV